MSAEPLGDQVWRAMAAFVIDHRDPWRRAVVSATGLPFSRVRLLRRLARGSTTGSQLAAAAAMDAPAATVALNDLQARGLVTRTPDPANRRRKLVTLSEAGHRMLAEIDALPDPAPAAVASLDDTDLRTLGDLLAKLRH